MPQPPVQSRLQLLQCEAVELQRWSYPDLSAPFWRVYWNSMPGAWVEGAGGRLQLDPTNCVLIAPRTAFATGLTVPVRHHYLHLRAGPPYDEAAPGIHRLPLREEWQRLLAALPESGAPPPDAATALFLQAAAATMLVSLPTSTWRLPRRDPRIALVLRRLQEIPLPTPDNARLARSVDMHPSAFGRLFRTATGESPQAYARRLRLEQAAALLANSERSIDAIAEDCGFCDRHHFSRAFARCFGVPPAAYRRSRGGM